MTATGAALRIPVEWTAERRAHLVAATCGLKGFLPHLRIRQEEGGPLIPLVLNRAQRIIRAATRDHRHVLILKGRRLGITTWALAEALWRVWLRPHFAAVMIGHKSDDATNILQTAQIMHDNLPDYMQPPRETRNSHEIRYPRTDTAGVPHASALTVGTARGVGVSRGDALQWVHMTEAAFYPPDSATLVSGLLEAGRGGRVMMETTANGAHGDFYDLWMANRAGDGPWHTVFAPWWWDDRNRVTLTPKERAAYTYTPEERAWAEPAGVEPERVEWYRRKRRLLRTRMLSEYPCSDLEAFVATGRHFFDQVFIVDAARRCPPPIRTGENGALSVWEEPQDGASYVAGGDPADGTPNGSYSCLSIHKKDEHFRQVARLRGRWVPREFARLTARLCAAYNQAFVVPERNRLEYVRALVHDEGYRFVFRRRNKSGEQDREPGFLTDGQTRPYMLDVLKAALEGDGETEPWLIVNDPVFYGECMTFEDEGGGRYSAADGKYDDSIFAVALAVQGRGLGLSKIVRLFRSGR